MARTTVDIDDSVLAEVRQRAEQGRKPLGQLVSELLARALADERPQAASLVWDVAAMAARVDLDDKETVYRLLDEA